MILWLHGADCARHSEVNDSGTDGDCHSDSGDDSDSDSGADGECGDVDALWQ